MIREISRFVSPDPFIEAPDDPQSLNRYSYVVNNPQSYIDPSGFFFKKLFKKAFKWAFRVVFPVHAFASYFQAQVTSLTPAKVNAGFNIAVGAAMLWYGNPEGLFFIASGATAFGNSNGWQMASTAFGLAGLAAYGGAFGGPGGGGFGNPEGQLSAAGQGFNSGAAGNDYPRSWEGLSVGIVRVVGRRGRLRSPRIWTHVARTAAELSSGTSLCCK